MTNMRHDPVVDRHRRRLDDGEGRRRRPGHQRDPLERLPAPPDEAAREGARAPRARSTAAFPDSAEASSRACSSPAPARRRSRADSARKFVQEVNAVTLAVENLHPDVGSVIELGGQDAKIIMFKEDEKTGDKTAIAVDERQVRVGHRRHHRQVHSSRSACRREEVVRDRASTTRSCTTSPPSAACSPRPTSSTW